MQRWLWSLTLKVFYWAQARWPIGAEIAARVGIVLWVSGRLLRLCWIKRDK